ncbi:riboflavin deaminase [Xaviernesmea oryzae]|uniref:Riboflavin deaminase n=1 Tax=Xaviernesmea oryzae TaxID=464029 RepID=A0A1Q9B1K6_9HYPH|nr:dihydrofolate reductase family protein [Xaviernesmea oryzae]OLP61901.1 riboflavin deaminase [Xaviernesmea oryzae]SEL73780.1 Pyrimidine reductase, riboflavin biosynthesis [Xaviernesmea oryzae]
MKPTIICLMITSPDGSLHPSRWTASPDGSRSDWSKLYEALHAELAGEAWMVGRTTMAEISKAGPHPVDGPHSVERPAYFADRAAKSFAIAIDGSGKLHFEGASLYGDHVVVLLGRDVPDSHLAELAADGVSYLVSESAEMDVGAMLEMLNRELGIKRILLEGGAGTNGALIAAGLVDELSFVVAPALEARKASDRVVEFGTEGLAGKAELSLIGCDRLEHGAVHLRYKVLKPA